MDARNDPSGTSHRRRKDRKAGCEIPRSWWYGVAVGLLVLGCNGGSGGPPPADDGVLGEPDASIDALEDATVLPEPTPLPPLPESLGRIVVTPAAVLFTAIGNQATFHVEVLDASGQKIVTTLAWESSRAGMVAVDAEGRVTAMVEVGSSQVRVRAGSLVSAPVMVIVAQPAAGAVLVSDAQIIAGPLPIDPVTANQVGSNVALSVTGVPALSPGAILLASEGKPVAGRVVSATAVPGQDQLDVTLELIPLLDLFKRLDVDGSYDIDPVAMADALATASTPSSLTVEPPGYAEPMRKALTLGEIQLGPFKCEAKIVGGALTGSARLDLRPRMTFNHRFIRDEASDDWTELTVKLEGTLTITGSILVNLSPGFVGTVSCEAILVRIPVPVAGALSALIRFEIPLSIKGEITGTASIFSLKAAIDLKGESKIALGFQYTPQGGMIDMGDYSNETEMKPTFTVPDGEANTVSLAATIAFGGAAGVNLAVLVGSLNLLEANLMLEAEMKAGPIRNGLIFNGSYDLKPVVEAGAGSDVKKAMQWFGGLATVKPAITLTLPVIAQSPRGTFIADRMTVRPNQPVQLTVNLQPEWMTWLGLDNVVDVRIYRPHRTDVGFELVDTIGASPGKTSFTHTFTPTYLDAAAGGVDFWAGVSKKLLPGVALEINEMSKLSLKVGDGASLWKGTVTVTCSAESLETNGDTFSEKTIATIELEHLTEADALMANAKVTATATASLSRTHDYKAGSTACPIDVHEEQIGTATDFEPILFQTKFTDSSGDYALMGGAYVKGTQHWVHVETSSCEPPYTRTDPDSDYSVSVGYDISGKVEPDAASFSGSKNYAGDGESCEYTWNFSRIQ
jgi:hypothetical protein